MWHKHVDERILQRNISVRCLAVGIRGGPDLQLLSLKKAEEARGHGRGGGGGTG